MIEPAPIPVDEQGLQFKLHCKLKVFEGCNNGQKFVSNIVSTSSQYGLVFIGSQKPELQVVQTNNIVNCTTRNEVSDYARRTIPLSSPATHIAVNADNSLLVVVVTKNDFPVATIYNVVSFLSQNPTIVNEVRLSSTQGVFACDVIWNPGINNVFSVCMSNGSVAVYDLKPNGFELNTLPETSQSRCLSWSPKGKQIVIGAANGTLSQYKPDLKCVKTYEAPPVNNFKNITIRNVVWITNYQFAGFFQDLQDMSAASALIIVNTSKNGSTTYVNYEDVCYSSGNSRPAKFYLIHQQLWSVMFAASANSMEVGVLGQTETGSGLWQQWIQSDESRAELPLSNSKEETYPVGFCLDTGSTHKLPWGENEVLPPMPMLFILSHEGVLNVFDVINIRAQAPSICQPPQTIQDQSGIHLFTTPVPTQPYANIEHKVEEPINGTNVLPPTGASMAFTSAPKINPVISNTPATVAETSTKTETSEFGSNHKIGSFFNSTPQKPPTAAWQNSLPTSNPIESITQPITATVQPTTEAKSFDIPLRTIPSNDTPTNLRTSENFRTFQSELLSLKQSWKMVNIDVGDDDEKNTLVHKSVCLEEFYKELKDTTEIQRREIHDLKQMLIEGFALREEAHSRHKCTISVQFISLFKHGGVDSITNKQLSAITSLFYYVDSQLKQVNRSLDDEWNTFQDSRKQILRGTFQTPTLETVYQSMLKQTEIIKQQSNLLKDLKSKIKSRNWKISPLIKNVENKTDTITSLSKNVNNLLIYFNENDILLAKVQQIEESKNKLTKRKEEKLRSLLLSRKVTRVVPCKPVSSKLSSSMLLKSPVLEDVLSLTKSNEVTYRTPVCTKPENSIKKLLHTKDKATQLTTPLPTIGTPNNKSTAIINSSVPKKLSDYFEDVTPPSTPLLHYPQLKMFQKPTNVISGSYEENITSTDIAEFNINKMIAAETVSIEGNKESVETNISSADEPNTSILVIPNTTHTESKVKSTVKPQILIDSLGSPPISFTPLPTEKSNELDNVNSYIPNEPGVTTIASNLPQDETPSSVSLTIQNKRIFSDQSFQNPLTVSLNPSVTITPVRATNASLESSLPESSIFSAKSNPNLTLSHQKESGSIFARTSSIDKASILKIPTPLTTTDTNTISTSSLIGSGSIFGKSSVIQSSDQAFIDTPISSKSPPALSPPTSETISDQLVSQIDVAPPDSNTTNYTAKNSSATTFSFTSPVPTTKSIFGGFKAVTTDVTTTTATPTKPFGEPNKPFGFGQSSASTVAVTTSPAPSSTFSFGNLTVSALSPQTTSTSSEATNAGATPFNFVSATSSTPSTTNTANRFSFRQGIFGQPPVTTSIESSFMGKQICSPTAFAQNNQSKSPSIFGGQTTAAPNFFGQTAENTTNISVFGQANNTLEFPASTNVSNSPASGSIFAKPTASATAFGQQSGSIFGAKPNFGQPAFGQASTFGTQPPANNIFGGNPAFASNLPKTNLFNTSPATNFGNAGSPNNSSGAFSAGGQSINQSGFGANATFQKPAFGAAPTFPAAGGFGAPPTFGGSPTFNSPPKAFGSSSPIPQATSFGTDQRNSTFANLASQNIVGFGNLAQNQSPQQNQPPQFSGGSSFSSWR